MANLVIYKLGSFERSFKKLGRLFDVLACIELYLQVMAYPCLALLFLPCTMDLKQCIELQGVVIVIHKESK